MAITTRRPEPYAIHDGLAVYRIGSGEPVLLMPAPHKFEIPGDGSAAPLIEGLRGLGRRVLSFDPPGSGGSTRPARLSMREMHDCADEALDVCGVAAPVDAVGHNMAGLTVLVYAIERPGRVERLVLIGTGSGGPAYKKTPGALWNRTHPAFWRMASLAVLHIVWPRLAPERMLLNFIERRSFYDESLARPKTVSPRDWLRTREGRTDWHRVARSLDYAPRLAELGMPALVLCGRYHPQYPPACSEDFAAGIENARLVWFERSGHYPFVEEPDAFWHAVGDFLGRASVERMPGSAASKEARGGPVGS